MSDKQNFIKWFHPNDLYNLIDNSYEIAYSDSIKLNG